MKTNYFAATVLTAVTLLCAVTSQAETVTTRTTVTQTELPQGQKVDFKAFDVNRDGILSMEEVGERLFYLFDTDGNEVIDNIEFDRNAVLTIVPMEKETMRLVDFDDDGRTDVAAYDYDTFVQQSRLIMFDRDYDGLSAQEFIETGFLKLDADDSNAIELEEWKRVYADQIAYTHNLQGTYND